MNEAHVRFLVELSAERLGLQRELERESVRECQSARGLEQELAQVSGPGWERASDQRQELHQHQGPRLLHHFLVAAYREQQMVPDSVLPRSPRLRAARAAGQGRRYLRSRSMAPSPS